MCNVYDWHERHTLSQILTFKKCKVILLLIQFEQVIRVTGKCLERSLRSTLLSDLVRRVFFCHFQFIFNEVKINVMRWSISNDFFFFDVRIKRADRECFISLLPGRNSLFFSFEKFKRNFINALTILCSPTAQFPFRGSCGGAVAAFFFLFSNSKHILYYFHWMSAFLC